MSKNRHCYSQVVNQLNDDSSPYRRNRKFEFFVGKYTFKGKLLREKTFRVKYGTVSGCIYTNLYGPDRYAAQEYENEKGSTPK